MKTTLKKLYRCIAGDDNLFRFEHRIFNLTSFVITLFCIQGTLINYLLGLHMATVWLAVGGTFISSFLFYLARIKLIFTPALLSVFAIATVIILGPLHFFNGASQGPTIYLLIMMLNIFLLIATSKQQLLIYGIFTVSILAMLILEYQFPSWNITYENSTQRIADHVTVLIYSMFFTTVVIRLFRRSYDREQQIITDQKKELQEAYTLTTEKNKYIESLIRELHHRVKNNLQVVSSLMSLQSNRLDDDKAKQALEEGRTRVDAMAMIHQKLYLDNELAAVDMSDYLKNLSLSLANSFGFDNTNVRTTIELPGKSMDIDRAIPIGLIVNELLTNAFKHAFKDIAHPLISISLKQTEEKTIELKVADNGKGLQPAADLKKSGSFGMKLVHTLVDQLNGELSLKQNPGTVFTIAIRA